MADKTLKARIKLLYKTWAEWNQNLDFIPLAGEMCVVEAPVGTGESLNEPAILVKIGDGVKTFEKLPWLQAVASDVYSWAKKDSLKFTDLDEDFKAALASYVGAGNEYRISKNGDVYTLQSREYDAGSSSWSEWTDVADSSVDVSNKTDRKLTSAKGTALIFNESDGGGAKFEHTDGTNSFVGVNDGGKDGIAGQLYAVDSKNNNLGARINITAKGMFYTNGRTSGADYSAKDEIATKGDIENLGEALHYIGMTELLSNETLSQALARVVTEYTSKHLGYTLKAGAVAIVDVVEYIYNGSNWQPFGDEGLYATKNELEAAKTSLQNLIASETSARKQAIADEQAAREAAIEAEKTAREDADEELTKEIAKKTTEVLNGTNGVARVWNESDGGGVQFQNKDGTWSFVGVNDGGANGITGQLYSVDKNNGNLGTRMNMTSNGFFYFKGKSGATQYTEKDEIATKGDIEKLDDGLEDIAHTGNVNDLVQTDGDYLIIDGNA